MKSRGEKLITYSLGEILNALCRDGLHDWSSSGRCRNCGRHREPARAT